MPSPSDTIRTVIDQAAADEPDVTMLMAALQNHHGGGGLEWGSKGSAQSRHLDGEVRSRPDMLKALTGPIRKLLKDLQIDPKKSNPCIVGFRTDAGFAISLLVVSPGDVGKGEFASYESCTESESFAIANGPYPKRYPYAKMPQPIGTVVEIGADGTLGEPVRTVPLPMEWYYCPIDWIAVAGMPADMIVPDPIPSAPEESDGLLTRKDNRELDPFIRDVIVAISMQPPGIRDIRRIGVPNGFRDGRGNVID